MTSSEDAPHAIDLEALLRGYRTAYGRWMAGPRVSRDTTEAFLTLFEVLNWAVVVDDRLREVAGRGWSRADAQHEIVTGFRYARNTVHHDWSDALFLQDGAVLPTPLPFGFFEWCWRPNLPAKKRQGMPQYQRHLASQPVRFTLEALDVIYGRAVEQASE